MGVQQLLLIVLGTIVVGIAVGIGLNNFDANAQMSDRDALAQDCLRIAAAAQGYYKKPMMIGGGGNAFDGITIKDCGMPDSGSGAGTSLTGNYTIITSSGKQFAVMGVSTVHSSQTVIVTVDMSQPEADLQVQITYSS